MKPYFSNSAWYINIDGVRHFLLSGTTKERGKTTKQLPLRKEVREALSEFLKKRTKPKGIKVSAVVESYLSASPQYAAQLAPLVAKFGKLPADKLASADIIRWSKTKSWSDSTRRLYFTIFKQCFKYGVDEGMMDESPIGNLKIPAGERRENLISPKQVEWVNQNCDSDFVRFFNLLLMTGRRPSEIAHLKTSDVEGDMATMKKHKNKKRTNQSEIVYFSAEALEQIDWDSEQITGKVWTERQWQRAFEKLPFDCVAYDLRHTYITNRLLEGVPVPVVAELVGNSPAVLLKYYSKVAQSVQIRQWV